MVKILDLNKRPGHAAALRFFLERNNRPGHAEQRTARILMGAPL
jgi:hypothetical protein